MCISMDYCVRLFIGAKKHVCFTKLENYFYYTKHITRKFIFLAFRVSAYFLEIYTFKIIYDNSKKYALFLGCTYSCTYENLSDIHRVFHLLWKVPFLSRTSHYVSVRTKYIGKRERHWRTFLELFSSLFNKTVRIVGDNRCTE